MAIFASILLPSVSLMGTILTKYSSSDLIISTNLAREEMEETLNSRAFTSEDKIIKLNNVSWKISKKVSEDNKLLFITIEVSKLSDDKVIASLYTEKYLGQ